MGSEPSSDPGPTRAPKLGQMERTREAVLTATSALLEEVGYRNLTMDLITQRSGVGRSTIYRRWGSVAELVMAAFEETLGVSLPPPDHGDVRTDLIHLYRRFAKILQQSMWGRVLPSLIEASEHDPAFRRMLARVDRERRSNAREILNKAIARGELPQDTNIDWIIDSLSGLLYYRLLIAGTPLRERGVIEWTVDRLIQT